MTFTTLVADELLVLLGSKTGAFTTSFTQTNQAVALVSGDSNRDGVVDLATMLPHGKNGTPGGTQVFFGQGNGTFVLNGNYANDADLDSAARIELNGDGS